MLRICYVVLNVVRVYVYVYVCICMFIILVLHLVFECQNKTFQIINTTNVHELPTKQVLLE